MSKKRVTVRGIDPEIWENFKHLILSKYGTYHGFLGVELSKALQLYIDSFAENESTHTQIQDAKTGNYNISKRKQRLLGYIEEELLDYNEISNYDLENLIIKKTGCHDRRTIRSYVRLLLAKGTIKACRSNPTSNSFILMYKINRTNKEASE
jgi:hypothetical protein